MLALVIITIFTSIIYIVMIVLFVEGWLKIDDHKVPEIFSNDLRCSIILAARNESGNIENILSDLLLQEYPSSNFEIIVVNDHSDDRTVEIVTFFQQNNSITLLELPEDTYGKKQAISHGIKFATGELIITVDADCRLNHRWLRTLASFYSKYKPSLIICPVDLIVKQNFFNNLQNLEFLSLASVTAGSAGNNQAFMCNAANMAYQRELVKQMENPFTNQVSSGDDVFLLHNIKKQPNSRIMYLKNTDAIAYTNGCTSINEFIMQKIRWGSKAKLYRDADSILFSIIIIITNLLLFVFFSLVFFNARFLIFFLSLLAVKTSADLFLFIKVLPFFKKQNLLKYIVIVELLYFM